MITVVIIDKCREHNVGSNSLSYEEFLGFLNGVFKDGRHTSEYERDLHHYFFPKSSLKRAKEYFLRGNPSYLQNLDIIKIILKIGKKAGYILSVVTGHLFEFLSNSFANILLF